MSDRFDVAIIGGGIVGLAHAWTAARHGLSVGLFERSPRAQGASVRNFGMIWPIGQAAGENHAIAMRSRELWLRLGEAGVVDVEECGSVHLAHRPDELAVLEEFCGQATHPARMVTPDEALKLAPIANPAGLLAGLESSTELRVDPRTASARIADWLSSRWSVESHFESPVVAVESGRLTTSSGEQWRADRIVICSGSDLRTLFPNVLAESGLRLCKLQMLRTAPSATTAARSAHVASGLTLRHYANFETCSSLPALRQRVARETPELDRYGIHVMASLFPGGEIILGDSHEYGEDITPFDSLQIDQLMLRELRSVLQLRDWTISQRWHGIYAKHPQRLIYETEVADGVHVCVGPGGAGMTLSFGLADRAWTEWTGVER